MTTIAAHPQAPDGLDAAFAALTRPTDDGHLEWAGPVTNKGLGRFRHNGASYTSAQAAYTLRTGSRPHGMVKRVCDRPGCRHPEHVDSNQRVPDGYARQPSDGWQDSAACLTTDTNLFYRDDTEAAARRECFACPVRVDCLEAALIEEGARSRSDRHGVRGGVTSDERHSLYRRRRRAAARAAKAAA